MIQGPNGRGGPIGLTRSEAAPPPVDVFGWIGAYRPAFFSAIGMSFLGSVWGSELEGSMRKVFAVLALSAWAFCADDVATYGERTDQASAREGELIDGQHLDQLNTALDLYDKKSQVEGAKKTGEDFKRMKQISASGALDEAEKKMISWRNSKSGLITTLTTTLNKISGVITKIGKRVDRWRTTLPKLQAYGKAVDNFYENSGNFLGSFELSDLYDLDRKWSKELETRVTLGKWFGISILDWLLNRKNGVDKWAALLDAYHVEGSKGGAEFRSVLGAHELMLKDLPKSRQYPSRVLLSSMEAMNTIEVIQGNETKCVQMDAEGNCLKTVRDQHTEAMYGEFTRPNLTLADLNKLDERIQRRRLEIARYRQLLQESKARLVDEYASMQAMAVADKAMAQEAGCVNLKSILFRKGEKERMSLLSGGIIQNGSCADVQSMAKALYSD